MFDPRWADAISSIESGGNYGILGPVTQKGDRAYGRYQVMGSNVGPWTKEVLGRSMTPAEFVNSPAAQDAVFQAKFGQAAAKYGNPQDAASVWFTGKPLAQGASRKDVLGTTGQSYVDKFSKALGQSSQPPPQVPTQVAQAQPAQASPVQSAAPQGGFSSPAQAMPQQMPQQSYGGLNAPSLGGPQPRRINVAGLLGLLQNNPQLRGLLQG
jgi:hypothetical protein